MYHRDGPIRLAPVWGNTSLLTHTIDTPAQDFTRKFARMFTSLDDNFSVNDYRGDALGVLVWLVLGGHFTDLVRVEHRDVGPVPFQ